MQVHREMPAASDQAQLMADQILTETANDEDPTLGGYRLKNPRRR
jgi:hypothetical protein